jgi:folate-binding protein YgfZ
MASATTTVARRRRAYLRVTGPDAADYLQRMLSNDVEALAAGEACPALLLTPKARVIAPVVVLRRGDDDFLLLTEPELGAPLQAHLVRMRLRARCEIAAEEHTSVLVFDSADDVGFARELPGTREVLDSDLAPTMDDDELELRRIEAGIPAWGKEIDDRILPAEAGLDATHVSFEKGCYPGQEPVARLHYRGHPNRTLRKLELEGTALPPYDAEIVDADGRVVGRVTSAARRPDGSIAALGYVRADVPADVELTSEGRTVTLLS